MAHKTENTMVDEMTPRVPYITSKDQITEDQRSAFKSIEDSRGGVRGPFGVLMNSPEIADRVGELGAYIRFDGALSGTVRELAILTTAREFDCAYEWVAHEPIAREEGVNPDSISVVASQGSVAGLEPTDAVVIQYGCQLFRQKRISAELFAEVEDFFDTQEVTELTATMGYYGMLACVMNAFEVLPDESPEKW